MLSRRLFLGGLLAAPAVVRSGVLMPIKPLVPEPQVAGMSIAFWAREVRRAALLPSMGAMFLHPEPWRELRELVELDELERPPGFRLLRGECGEFGAITITDRQLPDLLNPRRRR